MLGTLGKLAKKQMFIPIATLILLTILNLVVHPSFFAITVAQNSAGMSVLQGQLISIIDFGSELAILAIGMTLVTAASGGQDISVGATIVITASVMLRLLNPESNGFGGILVAFLVALLVGMICGAFNGILVSAFKIQPMIATLILFTAGRPIANWINAGEQKTITDSAILAIGNNLPHIPIPTPVIVAAICFVLIALVMKFTTLGLYVQSVGINSYASKLNGLNPAVIKLISFIMLGAFVAVCGFIKLGRIGKLTYAVTAKDIEMDAILAVALGGNALSGGKFNITASILGAYAIQYLTTTLTSLGVSSEALKAYKAGVVIILVIISAPYVRDRIGEFFKKLTSKSTKGVA